MIFFVNGNIFQSKADALVNPTNCAGTMGAGLALEFKKLYPTNFLLYKQACDEKRLRPGKVLTVIDKGKYIINFPSKDHYKDPSQYQYIQSGLEALIESCNINKIVAVAMPKVGCGLGGLNWEIVKTIIIKTLSYQLFDVEVYE